MNLKQLKQVCILILFIVISRPNILCQNEYSIIDKTVRFGMREAVDRKINAIIVHSVFNNLGGEKYDIDLIMKQFSHYGVSSHYIIGRDGSIYYLVNEKNIAFHAGRSQLPNGQIHLNETTIGIELVTSFDEAPTHLQIRALTLLANDIRKRYKIDYILRHSDIAPGRKTDPWNMDWDGFLNGIAQ